MISLSSEFNPWRQPDLAKVIECRRLLWIKRERTIEVTQGLGQSAFGQPNAPALVERRCTGGCKL
jgi:hypothetical protein